MTKAGSGKSDISQAKKKNKFPWQATPKLVKLLQDVVFFTKVNRKCVFAGLMGGHELVIDRGYRVKPV